MDKPNVLLIADEKDVELFDVKGQARHWNIFWQIVNYNKLLALHKIRNLIAKHRIDFIFYSRNDQVANRISIGSVTKKLRVGYSSFSGIDEIDRTEQTRSCFEDFLECNRGLSLEAESRRETGKLYDAKGTFSLVFDTEQVGGARYGLPRIITLLNKYNMRATFFVTNLIKKIYSNILEEIARGGHQIGIHGKWHEYLSNFDLDRQRSLIAEMKEDFGSRVYGANFIGRMNQDTVSALIENGMEYFVYPRIIDYRPFGYPRLPLCQYSIRSPQGSIWMIPISVETYNRPWLSVKNTVDSAILCSRKNNTRHISILLHPFRDGNLQHVRTTEKLVRYLSVQRKLRSITLEEFVDKVSRESLEYQCVDIRHFKDVCELQSTGKLLPKTKLDLFGFLFENSLNVYRLIRRGRTVF